MFVNLHTPSILYGCGHTMRGHGTYIHDVSQGCLGCQRHRRRWWRAADCTWPGPCGSGRQPFLLPLFFVHVSRRSERLQPFELMEKSSPFLAGKSCWHRLNGEIVLRMGDVVSASMRMDYLACPTIVVTHTM